MGALRRVVCGVEDGGCGHRRRRAADPNGSAAATRPCGSWTRGGRRGAHSPALATRTSGLVGLLRNWPGRAVRTLLERAHGRRWSGCRAI